MAFRRRVARSGLLEVPGERYIERRFTCRAVLSSSLSLKKSFDGDIWGIFVLEGPATGDGVGGTIVGVEGWGFFVWLEGVLYLGSYLGDFGNGVGEGLSTTPRVLISTPSLSITVP